MAAIGHKLIGWRTDAGNQAGTAHVFMQSLPDGGKPLARAVCGREVLVSDLQPESESLRRCTRCSKSAPGIK